MFCFGLGFCLFVFGLLFLLLLLLVLWWMSEPHMIITGIKMVCGLQKLQSFHTEFPWMTLLDLTWCQSLYPCGNFFFSVLLLSMQMNGSLSPTLSSDTRMQTRSTQRYQKLWYTTKMSFYSITSSILITHRIRN